MKCVVTGAAGFIGSHLVDRLLIQGNEVVAIDDLSNGLPSNIDYNAHFNMRDVRDYDIAYLFDDTDFVFHQAAIGSVPRSIEHPTQTYQANVQGFQNILRICEEKKVKKLIYASSSSVYGNDRNLPKTEDKIGRQLSPYSASKRINEIMAEASPIQTVGLRYFNVFGPRQRPDSPYSAVIPKWIKAIKDGSPITIHGDGTAVRDFTYVDNVVEANIRAMLPLDKKNEVFNIGTGEYQLINNLLVELIKLTGADKYEVAKRVTRDLGSTPPMKTSFADISKAKELLKYEVMVPFLRGLYQTVESMK